MASVKDKSKSSKEKAEEIDWDAEWEAMARKIDSAWKSEKSALEIITEIRR